MVALACARAGDAPTGRRRKGKKRKGRELKDGGRDGTGVAIVAFANLVRIYGQDGGA